LAKVQASEFDTKRWAMRAHDADDIEFLEALRRGGA
jgi:hypothetical protein